MPPEEKAMFDKLRRSVCECREAVYGFARSGRDFIMSFGWLIMNRWLTVPEAPALHVLWHDGDDAGAIKRAIEAREHVGVRGGRNVLVRAAVTFSAQLWREETTRRLPAFDTEVFQQLQRWSSDTSLFVVWMKKFALDLLQGLR